MFLYVQKGNIFMTTVTTDAFELDVVLESIIKYIESSGIYLQIGTDFYDYAEALKQQEKRHFIGPIFSIENQGLGKNNAFWIIGRNKSDEIVHTQAVHLIDLKDQTLAAYLQKHIVDFSSFTDEQHNLRFNPGPSSGIISGQACYHGEFWLNLGVSRCGNSGMATLLSKLAMILSLQHWNVDCFFSFIIALNACRGLAARGGYMHTEPYSVVWEVPDRQEEQEAWLAWSNQIDIKHLINITAPMLAQSLRGSLAAPKANHAVA